MFSPQVAILNVPLEFLSRVRKVTIIMDDNSSIELERQDISSEADTENLPAVDATIKERQPLLEQSPCDMYLQDAHDLARVFAADALKKMVDPYKRKFSGDIKSNQAWNSYTNRNGNRALERTFGSVSAACDAFFEEVKRAFYKEIDQHAAIEGEDKALRALFVSAREDKARCLESTDSPAVSTFDENLATVRACISLLSGELVSQELATGVSLKIPERVAFYRKAYDEFEPPKEGD
jgi:hypothetical protein